MVVILSLFNRVPSGPFDGMSCRGIKGSASGIVEYTEKREKTTEISLKRVSFTRSDTKESNSFRKLLVYIDLEEKLQPGNRVTVNGLLMQFEKPGNPGEFNPWYYYKSKDYDYKMNGEALRLCRQKTVWHKVLLTNMQSRVSKVYKEVLPERKAALLSEMLLGEKAAVPEEIKRLYQKNGIGHLLAISGLHISLIGMGAYRLAMKGLRYKKAAVSIGIFLIVAYGVMTGLSISASRAVIMSLLGLFAVLLGRTYDMPTGIAVSGVIILIFHPLEIRNGGFLLSFGASAGIAVIYPIWDGVCDWEKPFWKKYKYIQLLAKNLMVSLSVQLAITPVILSTYGEIPLYGIALNLIVVPLASMLMFFSVLAGIAGFFWTPGAYPFAGAIYIILECYEKLCSFTLKLPGANRITGFPKPGYLCFYYIVLIVVLVCLFYLKKPWILAGMALVFAVPMLPANPGLEATVLDVGQGDGIYIETRENYRILIDGGSSSKGKVGKYVLEPFLKAKGAGVLDYVFVTHLDEDHVNGVIELMEYSKIGGIQMKHLVLAKGIEKDKGYETVTQAAKRAGVPIVMMKRGDTLQCGKLRLHCLHPGNQWNEDKNENSIVLEAVYGRFTMLLTGDLGKLEQEVMGQLHYKTYDVLKAGHHGSDFSSQTAFLERTAPKHTVISCGRYNSYGHPGKKAVARILEAGSRIHYTMNSGAVKIITNGEKLGVDYFKKTG